MLSLTSRLDIWSKCKCTICTRKLFSTDAKSSTSQPQFFPPSDLVNKVIDSGSRGRKVRRVMAAYIRIPGSAQCRQHGTHRSYMAFTSQSYTIYYAARAQVMHGPSYTVNSQKYEIPTIHNLLRSCSQWENHLAETSHLG